MKVNKNLVKIEKTTPFKSNLRIFSDWLQLANIGQLQTTISNKIGPIEPLEFESNLMIELKVMIIFVKQFNLIIPRKTIHERVDRTFSSIIHKYIYVAVQGSHPSDLPYSNL